MPGSMCCETEYIDGVIVALLSSGLTRLGGLGRGSWMDWTVGKAGDVFDLSNARSEWITKDEEASSSMRWRGSSFG